MIDEDKLVKLKEKYTHNEEVLDLIIDLAVANSYLRVHPAITLKTIDQIVRLRHDRFTLVKTILTGTSEGTMSMEFYYDIIFQDSYNYSMYGIQFECSGEINGEMWDDYVANEGEETWDVHKVKEEIVKETKYIFDEKTN